MGGCATGLPEFSCCNIPKRVKIYQMTTKYTYWHYNISNGYKISIQGLPKYVIPNWDFRYANIPSGNPDVLCEAPTMLLVLGGPLGKQYKKWSASSTQP
jgi:hypothetical protein